MGRLASQAMSVAVLIVAAGSGERLGAGVPKALVELGGQPILDWAVWAFVGHPGIDSVIVLAPPESLSLLSASTTDQARVIAGGPTRQASVGLGLSALDPGVEWVLVHDAARPLVTAPMISSVLAALRAGADAVIPVLPVIDTVKRVGPDGRVLATVDRAELRLVQTPQGFRREVLIAAHAAARATGWLQVTDDAGLVEAIGQEVLTVRGDEAAFKITTPYDLALAQRLVAR